MHFFPYKVQGIPCILEWSESHDCGFEILDTRFNPAEWLQDKMTEGDIYEAISFLDRKAREEAEDWGSSQALDS